MRFKSWYARQFFKVLQLASKLMSDLLALITNKREEKKKRRMKQDAKKYHFAYIDIYNKPFLHKTHPQMVVHTFNPSTQEADAGRSLS